MDELPIYTDEEFEEMFKLAERSEENRKKLDEIISILGVPTQ